MSTMKIMTFNFKTAYGAKIVAEGRVCVRTVSSVTIGNIAAGDCDTAASVGIHNLKIIK